MGSEDQIIEEIEEYVDSNYESWRIGITDNPDRRKREHHRDGKDTSMWRHWNAGSDDSARSIELHFQVLGMDGEGGGGDEDSTYVYVF